MHRIARPHRPRQCPPGRDPAGCPRRARGRKAGDESHRGARDGSSIAARSVPAAHADAPGTTQAAATHSPVRRAQRLTIVALYPFVSGTCLRDVDKRWSSSGTCLRDVETLFYMCHPAAGPGLLPRDARCALGVDFALRVQLTSAAAGCSCRRLQPNCKVERPEGDWTLASHAYHARLRRGRTLA